MNLYFPRIVIFLFFIIIFSSKEARLSGSGDVSSNSKYFTVIAYTPHKQPVDWDAYEKQIKEWQDRTRNIVEEIKIEIEKLLSESMNKLPLANITNCKGNCKYISIIISQSFPKIDFTDHYEVRISFLKSINKKDEDLITKEIKALVMLQHYVSNIKITLKDEQRKDSLLFNTIANSLLMKDKDEINYVLVLKKVDTNTNVILKNYLFLQAAWNNKIELVKELLKFGTDINFKNSSRYNETALMLAAGEGHLEMIKLLLEKGAKKKEVDKFNQTALIWAKNKNKIEATKLLE